MSKEQEAEEYFNKGVQKMEGGNYEGALKDFEEVINLNSKDADTLNNRGLAKDKLGRSQRTQR